MDKKRDSFSGKLGFIFAAAGSAVGLGNLWRFRILQQSMVAESLFWST